MRIQFVKNFVLYVMLLLIIIVSPAHSGQVNEPSPNSNRQIESELTEIDFNVIALRAVLSISSPRWFRPEVKRKTVWIALFEMQNDTDEHLDSVIIMEKIQSLLIKNHKVRFIDSMLFKEYLKKRNLQERDLYLPSKIAEAGKTLRAGLVLKARVASVKRLAGFNQQITYFFTFQVIDTVSMQVKWSDQVEISKIKERQMYRE
jgi:PBP1b-binding outer membrane lipoprotein LpoB